MTASNGPVGRQQATLKELVERRASERATSNTKEAMMSEEVARTHATVPVPGGLPMGGATGVMSREAEEGAATGMERDPVCSMLLHPDAATTARVVGARRYIFCSMACAERFDATPVGGEIGDTGACTSPR
jgi:YHS domain-containing protein